jgi:hypothetical protein
MHVPDHKHDKSKYNHPLQRRYFRFLAVSSAKPDDIFWKTFEETLFSLLK